MLFVLSKVTKTHLKVLTKVLNEVKLVTESQTPAGKKTL